MLDTIIKGARVIDGLGSPEQDVAVGIKNGRIAEMGQIHESALEVLNVDGLVLSPGIIDTHTHYDAQLTWDSTASPSPALGVTTIVIGNCGFGIAPCPPRLRETVVSNLSVVEGMDLNALLFGIDWGFETFPEYMNYLREKGVYPNTAVLAGHSVTRSAVMGKEASERSKPTDSEMSAMKNAVKEALDAGAIGFASSFSPNHMGWNGVPMPSTIASDNELIELASLMKGRGHGVFQIASGARGTVEMMEGIADATGGPVFMTTALTMYNEALPGKAHQILDRCKFEKVVPHVSKFKDIKAGSAQIISDAYRDPSFRERFKEDLAAPKPGGIFYGDWNKVEISLTTEEHNISLIGHTIAQVAAERSEDPVDTFCNLALDENLGTTIVGRFLNSANDGVAEILKHESGIVSLSDAGAHLIFMCDAGFGTHFLGHWVRNQGLFNLVEGIRRLTSRPAALYGIKDRGRISIGAYADLLLFDPDNIGMTAPIRINDLPGGGTRTIRNPKGIHSVWVNGSKVFDGGSYIEMNKGPGAILDKFDRIGLSSK